MYIYCCLQEISWNVLLWIWMHLMLLIFFSHSKSSCSSPLIQTKVQTEIKDSCLPKRVYSLPMTWKILEHASFFSLFELEAQPTTYEIQRKRHLKCNQLLGITDTMFHPKIPARGSNAIGYQFNLSVNKDTNFSPFSCLGDSISQNQVKLFMVYGLY